MKGPGLNCLLAIKLDECTKKIKKLKVKYFCKLLKTMQKQDVLIHSYQKISRSVSFNKAMMNECINGDTMQRRLFSH